MRRVALRHDVARAAFAAAALGGHTEFELDIVKPETSPRVADNFAVRNPLANTNYHGGKHIGWLLRRWRNYKYESVAFAIAIVDCP